MTLQAIKWEAGKLEILDQLLLPGCSQYIEITDVEGGWNAINNMQVRGPAAIAIVGCLSLAVEIQDKPFNDKETLLQEVKDKLEYITTSRPAALNIKLAADEIIRLAIWLSRENLKVSEMKEKIISEISWMLERDVSNNKSIGYHGAAEILKKYRNSDQIRVITHCNTGSLSTAGYGTALGVIRSLHSIGKLEHVYCTETRPYNHGARLTAYELVYDNIPSTLVCDDMVASLMKSKTISAVVVGADRIVANGDTANKIGTYQIAVLAKYHNVPFYIAAPSSTIDFSIPNGDGIQIEERPQNELTHVNGVRIAAEDINVWNAAFDVTPAELVEGIFTEKGVYKPNELAILNR